MGWTGVVSIAIGIALLSNVKFSEALSLKAPLLALGVGICIASYIVVDKIALNYVSAVVLNEIRTIGNLLALSWAACNSGGIQKELSKNWKLVLLCGLIAPGGYLLFLFALSLGPVAQLAPMREIGTVFGCYLGGM